MRVPAQHRGSEMKLWMQYMRNARGVEDDSHNMKECVAASTITKVLLLLAASDELILTLTGSRKIPAPLVRTLFSHSDTCMSHARCHGQQEAVKHGPGQHLLL